MKFVRLSAIVVMGVGILLMGLVLLSAQPPAYAGVLHGTPDPNATPDITADEYYANIPTYYADIEPIIQAKCVACHVEGGIGYAAFPMDSVAEITDPDNAEYIAFVTGIEYMPPWPPSDESLPFLHERDLSDEQIASIAAWVEAGAPLGDEADRQTITQTDVPAVRADVVLTMPEPYMPDDSRTDDYRCFLLDTNFDGDQYLTGYNVDPGADEIVHHVLVYQLDPSALSAAQAMDAQEAGPGWECFGGPGVPMNGGGGGGGNSALQDLIDPVVMSEALQRQGVNPMDVLAAIREADIQAQDAQSISQLYQVMEDLGVDLDQLFADMDVDFMRIQAESVGSSGIIAGWVPGVVPTQLLPNTGRFLAQDSVLVMQVHYNMAAGAMPDQTSLMMQLEPYREDIVPVSSQVFLAPVEIPCPEGVDNPACDREVALVEGNSRAAYGLLPLCGQTLDTYADNTAENAYGYCDYTLPYDGWMVEVGGHMHELGEETRVTINPDSADPTVVIAIPDWDFHWQGNYHLAEPLPVKAGDTLRLECWWDNSDGERYVVWGEGTADEMCFNTIGFIWNPVGLLALEDFAPVDGTTEDTVGHDHAHSDETAHVHADGELHDHTTLLDVGGYNVPAPTVQLLVTADAVGGYNVHIVTTDFVFAPQDAGYDPVAGVGHAHLYVNGEKVARVYDDWYHLDSLPTGQNTVTVTLNANNHQPLGLNGVPIEDSSTIHVQHADATHSHAEGTPHDHATLVEVGGTNIPAPTVDLMVMPDPVSGYNVHIMTTDFNFAPDHASSDAATGEGHAHLYVNGEKVARVYGDWYHLDSLPTGQNTITVTLNANNHQPLGVNGVPIEATVLMTVE